MDSRGSPASSVPASQQQDYDDILEFLFIAKASLGFVQKDLDKIEQDYQIPAGMFTHIRDMTEQAQVRIEDSYQGLSTCKRREKPEKK